MEILDRIADITPLKLVLDVGLIVGAILVLEKCPFAQSVVRHVFHMDKGAPK